MSINGAPLGQELHEHCNHLFCKLLVQYPLRVEKQVTNPASLEEQCILSCRIASTNPGKTHLWEEACR